MGPPLPPVDAGADFDAVAELAALVCGASGAVVHVGDEAVATFGSRAAHRGLASVVDAGGRTVASVVVLADRDLGLSDEQQRALDLVAAQAGRLVELHRLSRERERTNRALEETRALLVHQALHDPLTALPNRRLLLDRIEHSLAGLDRIGGNVAVFFIDLDGFKPVNDRLGHHAGDRLLVELAHRLRGVVRAGDTLSRVGGDEFVVVARIGPPETASTVATRLVEAASEPVDLGEEVVAITVSVGVAIATSGDVAAVALVDAADQAMYQAKRAGGDRVALA